MKRTTHKPIQTLLRASPIQGLLAKIHELQGIERDFKKTIPEELARHCQIANYREGCLYLLTENAAWATRIRFLEPQIIKLMAMPDLKRIHCMIKPSKIKQKIPQKRYRLSLENIAVLQETVDYLSPSPLQAALQRLISSNHSVKPE